MEKISLAFINYLSVPLAFLELKAWLYPDELARARAMVRESARREFLAGRLLVRTVLGNLLGQAPEAFRLSIDAGGKPRCESHPEYNFSLSHSGGIAAVAVARMNVGLDIEAVQLKRQYLEIAKTVYSVSEQNDLSKETEDQPSFFYSLWTLKEAWLKLHGLGIGDLGRCPDFELNIGQKLVQVRSKTEESCHFLSWRTESPTGQSFILSLAAQQGPHDSGKPTIEIVSPFDDSIRFLQLELESGSAANSTKAAPD